MTCAGVGALRKTIKENVVIPKGVYNGVTLRMAKKGNSSTQGGGNGDLLLKVQIRPHPYFERDGADVKVVKFITVT